MLMKRTHNLDVLRLQTVYYVELEGFFVKVKHLMSVQAHAILKMCQTAAIYARGRK